LDEENRALPLGQLSEAKVNTTSGVTVNPKPAHKPAIEEKHEHIHGRGIISSIALGITDGLVTNLAFLAGFAGARYSIGIIQFAGLAAMIAGAVSMFFGGFLAARSEQDLYHADASREAQEIEAEPEEERQELKTLYMEKGLTGAEADMVVERIASDKKIWLKDLLTHELHIHEEKLESPFKIGLAISQSFLAGAFVPLSIYFLPLAGPTLTIGSVLISLIFLFAAGAWKGQIAKRRVWRGGIEMLVVGALASLMLYVIGTLI